MHKLWLIARHEYVRMAGRRSFLLTTLAIPVLMTVVIVALVLIISGNDDLRPVGYVDGAGVLAAEIRPVVENADRALAFHAFADEEQARSALEAGEIQAIYVLPSDYLAVGEITVYYWDESPGDAVWSQFDAFLRVNLASGLSEDVRQRAIEGPSMTVRSADGRREVSSKNLVTILLPFAAGFFFMITVMSSAGYLLQAVTTEKENRTMEVMVTSLTPEQLMVGKALGLMAVSLTQIALWSATVAVGLIVGARFFELLRDAQIPWAPLGIAAIFFLPAFALVAGIMITIGSMVTETQQGQQIAGIVNLFFIAPFFFLTLIIANPDSPILVVLTLFPTTAFITIVMRWALALVPVWQMVLSWVILTVSAGLSIWAAARVLRAGMLRYGQRLDLRGVLRAIRAHGR